MAAGMMKRRGRLGRGGRRAEIPASGDRCEMKEKDQPPAEEGEVGGSPDPVSEI
jgi:hypothetical protein